MRYLLLFVFLLGCGGSAKTVDADLTSHETHGDECAVCGMVVDEQPAPRGQVVFRDGTHKFTCSLGDLRAYVQAPNPLGDPARIYVEDVGENFDIKSSAAVAKPWIDAGEASYVVGIQRAGIMGEPAVSFRSAREAAAFAESSGGRLVSWSAMKTTPFNKIPLGN